MFKPRGFSTRWNDSVLIFSMIDFQHVGIDCVQLIVMTGFQLMGMAGFQLMGMIGFQLRWMLGFQPKGIRNFQRMGMTRDNLLV